ncbi:MAG TPA: hypothetical protein VKR78_01060 [Acidimicrobiales bacterium]|nr:hypothetical protein [Acidimicrobiales bacterium]
MSLLRTRDRVTVDVLDAGVFYGAGDGAYSEATARKSAREAAKARGLTIDILSVAKGYPNWRVTARRKR